MPTIVKMPKWGLTMTTGKIADWLREEGSEVSAGDPLLVVETEKAVNDVEAPSDGILRKIVAAVGDEVPVTGPVAVLLAVGETIDDEALAALVAAGRLAVASRPGVVPTADGTHARRAAGAAQRDAGGRINASPAARRLAQDLGIDLETVEATGPGGRITSDDVERAVAAIADDPSPREGMVTLPEEREIAYLLAGPGQATKLVFLHGLGGSLGTWQVVLGDLADRYRVCALDLPGHGGSDKGDPASVDYTAAGLAAAIGDALAALGIGRAIVVGHSLGAAVALKLAAVRPEAVGGLVLVNGAGLGEEISAHLLDLMDAEPGEPTARAMLDLFYEDKRLIVDRAVTEMAAGQRGLGAWEAQRAVATAAFSREGQLASLRLDLASVTVPTLIVWGERDRVIPFAHALAAARTIPDAVLVTLPDVGHVPQVEAASRLSRAIDRFATGISGRAG